jgi:hypothetical protein
VSTNVFRACVHHQIGSELERLLEDGRHECVIDDRDRAALMCQL